MDKLIELLNKHRKEMNGDGKWYIDTDNYNMLALNNLDKLSSELWVISKEYGFIKWLVKKDKIDFDKCGLDIKQYLSYNKRYNKGIVMAENYDYDTFKVREFYSPYEQLLMILAIQDEPIEYLISVLK